MLVRTETIGERQMGNSDRITGFTGWLKDRPHSPLSDQNPVNPVNPVCPLMDLEYRHGRAPPRRVA